MKRFPTRTLDELDRMDWPRYLRALEADRIEQVEDRRALYLAQKLKAEDLTADDWERIQMHDEWMADG